MGMGLTVCRRLVEAQRGRIWLAPRDGGGLEVSFTLPVEPASLAGGADDD
jgi:two-component system sensor kinase FixL